MTLGGVVFGKLLNLVAVENSGARQRLRAFTTTSEQGVPSATTYIQYYSTALAEWNPMLYYLNRFFRSEQGVPSVLCMD